MAKGKSVHGLGTLKKGTLYGGQGGGAPSGLRRSFMGGSNLLAMRKSSVNRKNNLDEDDNSIGTDYSDDDNPFNPNKDLEYRQRNKELYKTLK